MTNTNPYQVEYESKCDCRCDLNLDLGSYDCGRCKPKVILKNIIETFMFALFVLEFTFGIVYINDDIYSNVYNLTNGTICDMQSSSLTTVDAQKLLICLGAFGFLMMMFRMLHFNTMIYLDAQEYYYLINTFYAFYWIFLLLETIFIIVSLVFLLLTCKYFDEMYNIYILSLVYNSVVSAVLGTLYLVDYLAPTPTDLRSILMQRRSTSEDTPQANSS